jgi:drug/metabolite transporter (DMT)-like permease
MLLTAGVLWSFSGVLIKQIHWNAWAIAASRSAIGGVLQFAFLVVYLRVSMNQNTLTCMRKKLTDIYLSKDKVHWCGALCFVTNMICLVMAFQLTRAANAVFLHFSGMVLVAVFSGPILNQKPTKQDWISVIAGLVGMLLISMDSLNPQAMLGTALGIVCAITLALSDICLGIRVQRNASQVAALETICLANSIMFVLGAPAIILGYSGQSMPRPAELLLLLILGIVPWAVPDILYALAIKSVPILRALILALLDPVLTAVWPMIVLTEIPSMTVMLGAGIAMGAVVYQTAYERALIKKNS